MAMVAAVSSSGAIQQRYRDGGPDAPSDVDNAMNVVEWQYAATRLVGTRRDDERHSAVTA